MKAYTPFPVLLSFLGELFTDVAPSLGVALELCVRIYAEKLDDCKA